MQSISNDIKSGADKISQAITPKPTVTPADDPISLNSKAKPGVELYVAVARLNEEQGHLPEAEAEYKKAYKESSTDLRVLLGYARLKDRLGQREEALKLYKEAVKAHPDDASVYNNLGIHYARCHSLRDSVAAMQKAIQLQPREFKYRNNLATVYVQMGKPQEAFTQLLAVHDEAAAHYNLGFLLVKNNQPQPAAQQFILTLRVNPNLVQARQWLERLNVHPNGMGGPEQAISAQPAPPQFGHEPLVAANYSPLRGQFVQPSYGPGNGGVDQSPVLRTLPAPPSASGASALQTPAMTPDTPLRRLPPVGDAPTATLESPRFTEQPPEDPPTQAAPLPPDSTRPQSGPVFWGGR
jgi:Tfp pilus assembly protein PilF